MLAPAQDHLSVKLDLNVRDFATSDLRQCAHSGNHLAPISAVTRLICHYSKKKYPLVSLLFSPHYFPLVSSVVTLARRRSTLPSPRPTSSVSLWNILRNNIGKDLSKVAMPVQLNEPINTLQRLCEELEYSELLDTANQTHDPYQRMVSGKKT